MSFLKKFPVILTMSNLMFFVITIHIFILANSFWEAFDWFNYYMADLPYDTSLLWVRFFWMAESILVLWWARRKVKVAHFG